MRLQTKEYKNREKKECPKCHHHGRDVKWRVVEREGKKRSKLCCNNCT